MLNYLVICCHGRSFINFSVTISEKYNLYRNFDLTFVIVTKFKNIQNIYFDCGQFKPRRRGLEDKQWGRNVEGCRFESPKINSF